MTMAIRDVGFSSRIGITGETLARSRQLAAVNRYAHGVTEIPNFKKLIDAGVAFSQLTQSRAEALVAEIVKLGQVETQDTQARIEAFVTGSLSAVERIGSMVQDEVTRQLRHFGLIDKEASAPAAEPTPTAAEPVKAVAKKAVAKKAVAKKAT